MMRALGLLAAWLALFLAAPSPFMAAPAWASGHGLPVPSQVIYPGDRISDAMLLDLDEPVQGVTPINVIRDRAELVGKAARRTLLPGRPITASAVEEPRAVSTGTQVHLVYDQDGLSISTTGMALQNGFVGQVVQVRNMDTGLTVFGAVQADGSVRVSGS